MDHVFGPFELRLHGFDAQLESQHPEVGFTGRIDHLDVLADLGRRLVVAVEDGAEQPGGLFEFLQDFLVRQLPGKEDLDERGAVRRIELSKAFFIS